MKRLLVCVILFGLGCGEERRPFFVTHIDDPCMRWFILDKAAFANSNCVSIPDPDIEYEQIWSHNEYCKTPDAIPYKALYECRTAAIEDGFLAGGFCGAAGLDNIADWYDADTECLELHSPD